ncbi:MAG: hypothetical protein GEV05_02410 [Betaproteobacteria bacterium]|nr:hypothetical protein [Betaproteobacteria bacterium]
MSARPMISAEGGASRPRLIYSAGYDLVTLGASDREDLTAHCRSLAAMRASIGWGTLGELCTVPAFGQADFSTDQVVAARIGQGPIIATAQVHRVSRLLGWAELWYTAWPGDWAHGACAQCIGRAVRWARRSGLASLVAYSKAEVDAEREMLARAGFVVSSQRGELIGELELLD